MLAAIRKILLIALSRYYQNLAKMEPSQNKLKYGLQAGIKKGWSGFVWMLKIIVPISFISALIELFEDSPHRIPSAGAFRDAADMLDREGVGIILLGLGSTLPAGFHG